GFEYGLAGHRVDEVDLDALIRIALLLAQAVQRLKHLGTAVVDERRGTAADADLVIDESRLYAAAAVEPARAAVALGDGLDLSVALRARHVVIDPGGVEELHQRPVEHVDPDHRLARIVAVVVPGTVRGQDQIATLGGAALALHDRVAAFVRQDGAAGIGGVQMDGCDIAGVVDRDRAADRVGDLQAAVQSGIEQKDALAVRELDRRYLGLVRNLGDAVQIRAEFAPAPHIGERLHLVGGDAARGELPAAFAARLAEPGTLRRRIRLGTDPDVVLGGVGVDG